MKILLLFILFILSCDSDSNPVTLPEDCAGVVGGAAYIDECDICGGDNSSCNQPIVNNLDIETFEDTPINFFINLTDSVLVFVISAFSCSNDCSSSLEILLAELTSNWSVRLGINLFNNLLVNHNR